MKLYQRKLHDIVVIDAIDNIYKDAIKSAEEAYFGTQKSSVERKLQSFVDPLIRDLQTELIFQTRKTEITPKVIVR